MIFFCTAVACPDFCSLFQQSSFCNSAISKYLNSESCFDVWRWNLENFISFPECPLSSHLDLYISRYDFFSVQLLHAQISGNLLESKVLMLDALCSYKLCSLSDLNRAGLLGKRVSSDVCSHNMFYSFISNVIHISEMLAFNCPLLFTSQHALLGIIFAWLTWTWIFLRK
jgi:hypothetical protein